MFFKMNVLKRMIKSAYKNGDLILGHHMIEEPEDSEEGLVIIGGWWSIYIDHRFVTKELKAALIEVAGELLDFGRYFRALEDGNQEMVEQGSINPMNLFEKCKEDVAVTKMAAVFQSKWVRILQNCQTATVTCIQERGYELIDRSVIDSTNGEYPPVGPRTPGDDIMCWGNNVCYIAIWPYKLVDDTKEHDKQMFLKELSQIALPS